MTGMRRGEIAGLRWSDVNLDAHRLAVRQTVTATGSQLTFGEPKTKRGKRSVALDRETVAALMAWKEAPPPPEQPAQREFEASIKPDT